MIGPGLFAPAPIAEPSGHAWPHERTERRLAPLLDRVPITRVYDATSLDRLGLPVWAAVTPLARDLKVHAGKGATHRAARLSALMEAVERVSAEHGPAGTRASYRQLRGRTDEPVLDPELFDLPFESRYRADRCCTWVRGYDLLCAGPAWVVRDLVISPARECLAGPVETNGLAAGNLAVEAVLHGLYEVIERDAAAHQRFGRRHAEGPSLPGLRLVALATLPEPARCWVARLEAAGISVTVEDLTHDLAVPAYRAVLADPAFPGREGGVVRFEGYGADLDADQAVARAVAEAVQAHTAVLVGARDTFEGGVAVAAGVGRLIERLGAPSTVTAFAGPAPLPGDLGSRLALVLERLRTAGFAHCVVVDLTRPELGVPVVRVLLAGAAGPYGETARRPSRRLLRLLV